MAKEILKDEVLSDSELDNVAGGFSEEIADDKKRFFQSGHLSSANADDKELARVFGEFGVKVELYQGCMLENMYSINGQPSTREEVWKYINGVIKPR